MVRVVGLEPTLLAERDFESGASTSSTTPASSLCSDAASQSRTQDRVADQPDLVRLFVLLRHTRGYLLQVEHSFAPKAPLGHLPRLCAQFYVRRSEGDGRVSR